jgi:hypothetical protein
MLLSSYHQILTVSPRFILSLTRLGVQDANWLVVVLLKQTRPQPGLYPKLWPRQSHESAICERSVAIPLDVQAMVNFPAHRATLPKSEHLFLCLSTISIAHCVGNANLNWHEMGRPTKG